MDSKSLLSKVISCIELPQINVKHEALVFFMNLIECISVDKNELKKIIIELPLFKLVTEEILEKYYDFSPE